MYHYKAKVTDIYDGDTLRADIDLGFGTWKINETFRLFGIDTPEMRGEEKEEGTKSRDWLREQILNKEVELETIKDKKGKYGRYLAVIWYNKENINNKLVSKGYAEYKDY